MATRSLIGSSFKCDSPPITANPWSARATCTEVSAKVLSRDRNGVPIALKLDGVLFVPAASTYLPERKSGFVYTRFSAVIDNLIQKHGSQSAIKFASSLTRADISLSCFALCGTASLGSLGGALVVQSYVGANSSHHATFHHVIRHSSQSIHHFIDSLSPTAMLVSGAVLGIVVGLYKFIQQILEFSQKLILNRVSHTIERNQPEIFPEFAHLSQEFRVCDDRRKIASAVMRTVVGWIPLVDSVLKIIPKEYLNIKYSRLQLDIMNKMASLLSPSKETNEEH